MSMILRNGLIISGMVVAGLGAGWQAVSSGGTPVAVFHSSSQLVNLVFSVDGPHGVAIHDLDQHNFQVLEDGRPQAVRYFSIEESEPLTIGILIDDSYSQRNALPDERRLAKQFLEDVMRTALPTGRVTTRIRMPGEAAGPEGENAKPTAAPAVDDRAMIISFDEHVLLLQDATASQPDLGKALDRVTTPQSGTALWDAVALACDRRMARENGRKALVILTNGVDHSSHVDEAVAVRMAQNTNTVVFSVLIGEYESGATPALVESLARKTGGRLIDTSSKGLAAAFQSIADELRKQYTLGYVSDRPQASGKFRKVAIKMVDLPDADRGAKVRAREGYTH